MSLKECLGFCRWGWSWCWHGEEVQDVLMELISVIVRHGDVVVVWVSLEGCAHSAKVCTILLRLWEQTGVLLLSNEHANWDYLVKRQVNELSLLDRVDQVPVPVRVGLESVLLRVLSVVIECLHCDPVKSITPSCSEELKDSFSTEDSFTSGHDFGPLRASHDV